MIDGAFLTRYTDAEGAPVGHQFAALAKTVRGYCATRAVSMKGLPRAMHWQPIANATGPVAEVNTKSDMLHTASNIGGEIRQELSPSARSPTVSPSWRWHAIGATVAGASAPPD